MKNITMSVDEQALAAVRRYAAHHNTSVNRLVRAFLDGIARREDEAKSVRKRIRELSRKSIARIGDSALSRADVHER